MYDVCGPGRESRQHTPPLVPGMTVYHPHPQTTPPSCQERPCQRSSMKNGPAVYKPACSIKLCNESAVIFTAHSMTDCIQNHKPQQEVCSLVHWKMFEKFWECIFSKDGVFVCPPFCFWLHILPLPNVPTGNTQYCSASHHQSNFAVGILAV